MRTSDMGSEVSQQELQPSLPYGPYALNLITEYQHIVTVDHWIVYLYPSLKVAFHDDDTAFHSISQIRTMDCHSRDGRDERAQSLPPQLFAGAILPSRKPSRKDLEMICSPAPLQFMLFFNMVQENCTNTACSMMEPMMEHVAHPWRYGKNKPRHQVPSFVSPLDHLTRCYKCGVRQSSNVELLKAHTLRFSP